MKTLEELRKEAEENYASRSCDGDCALCAEICHKSSDRMAFHAGWDAALKALIRCDDPKNCEATDIIDRKEFRSA